MSDELSQSLDLVRRAQEGDREALNRLIERYYDRVRKIVRARLGKRLREVCDSGDILKNALCEAIRSFKNFEMREEPSLIHWLSTIVQHQITTAADYHGAKKRDKRRDVSLSSAIGDSSSLPAANLLPDARETRPVDKVAANEQQRLVELCLDELSEEYRELIVQRDFTGLSWEIIAEKTGRPSGAAARMMHARAMIELAKLLRARGAS